MPTRHRSTTPTPCRLLWLLGATAGVIAAPEIAQACDHSFGQQYRLLGTSGDRLVLFDYSKYTFASCEGTLSDKATARLRFADAWGRWLPGETKVAAMARSKHLPRKLDQRWRRLARTRARRLPDFKPAPHGRSYRCTSPTRCGPLRFFTSRGGTRYFVFRRSRRDLSLRPVSLPPRNPVLSYLSQRYGPAPRKVAPWHLDGWEMIEVTRYRLAKRDVFVVSIFSRKVDDDPVGFSVLLTFPRPHSPRDR